MAQVAAHTDFDRRDFLIAAALYAASQALYALLGVRFDASPFPGYMQFIDKELLSGRLLESLWYYHAHPPLLNLFVGVGQKIFGERLDVFAAVCFYALGFTTALCAYALTLGLSASRVAAGIATGLIVFSPSFVLYENWLMYSFPAAALVTISAFALQRYAVTRSPKWGVAFFAVLATLLLTRSIFHLIWLLLVIGLTAFALRSDWRTVLKCAAAPLLIVALWYGKNYYLFGSFSASTMMGLGLSNISTLAVPVDDLLPLVSEGQLSKYALVSRYYNKRSLFVLDPSEPTGVPVLDQTKKSDGDYNFNYLGMIEVNRQYARDGFVVIKTFPASYAIGLIISNRLFFSPSSMNDYFTPENRAAVRPIEQIFNRVLLGVGAIGHPIEQPHFGFTGRSYLEVNTSAQLIVLWCLALSYGYVRGRRAFFGQDAGANPQALVIAFIFVTALYVYAVGTMVELAENYRYRFLIEPLFMVLTVTAAADLFGKVRTKLGKPAVTMRSNA